MKCEIVKPIKVDYKASFHRLKVFCIQYNLPSCNIQSVWSQAVQTPYTSQLRLPYDMGSYFKFSSFCYFLLTVKSSFVETMTRIELSDGLKRLREKLG
jgi:hypothetical protein